MKSELHGWSSHQRALVPMPSQSRSYILKQWSLPEGASIPPQPMKHSHLFQSFRTTCSKKS